MIHHLNDAAVRDLFISVNDNGWFGIGLKNGGEPRLEFIEGDRFLVVIQDTVLSQGERNLFLDCIRG